MKDEERVIDSKGRQKDFVLSIGVDLNFVFSEETESWTNRDKSKKKKGEKSRQ